MLLIEAGPDYPTLEQLPDEVKHGYATATDIMVSDHNWQFVGKATDKAPEMMVPRGRVTGGSSAINGQVFLRGVPEDYDAWAAWATMNGTLSIALNISARSRRTRTSVTAIFTAPTVRSFVRRFKRDGGCQTSWPSTTPVGQQDFQTVQTITTRMLLASGQYLQ